MTPQDLNEETDGAVAQERLVRHSGNAIHRLKHNPLEKRYADAWRQKQDSGLLEYLMGDGASKSPVSGRDEKVAATVIQWLGSPVGQGFLRDVNSLPNAERICGDADAGKQTRSLSPSDDAACSENQPELPPMKILTRADPDHNTEYVTRKEAEAEIQQLKDALHAAHKDRLADAACHRQVMESATYTMGGTTASAMGWATMYKNLHDSLDTQNAKDVAAAETDAQPHQTACSPSPRSAC